MNHYNAINITSDGNILTYISSKGLFTNSITTNDHIKYQLINDGETLPHYVVVDINMQSSNTSIIPEEKYDSNSNQYYPVTEINITLKAFDEVLTNKITHYLFVPNNVKSITIKNNDTNNNYILTINIPYQSLTADIADNLVNYQIVRYCSDQVISNYPLLSDIINLTYFSNSYFIIDSNYVSNNIEDCVNYVPNEEYELLKLISIAISKYYDNMQKLVYIKKLFISEETIKEGKEIEGLRYYGGNLMNINNDIVETISNKDLNKVTFDYQFIYYIDNNNIDRVNLSNSNKETISDNWGKMIIDSENSLQYTKCNSDNTIILSNNENNSLENTPTEKNSSKETNDIFVSEYEEDLIKELICTEKRKQFNLDKIKHQNEINSEMRVILIDWIMEMHNKFCLSNRTLFLSIKILDYYLSSYEISRYNFQLLGLTSLFIACKFEETFVPQVSNLVFMTADAYTEKDLIKMELTLLKKLNYL